MDKCMVFDYYTLLSYQLSLTAIVVMVDGVLAIVASIFYFQLVLSEPGNRQ